ncbi:MAG TPA: hypothetical protein VLG28_07275 [Acidimicrobiia bacterium]|jgi:hypothetical protein|nr:hypothetical protein [Acidimicrobiia bacterium]
MKAPTPPRAHEARDLNQLRRGQTYRARTSRGATVGEYLGIETPHGHRAILLRHETGTISIPVDEVECLRPAA